jgi:LmbE family N-acetylglucosaminyl deacetylase
LDGKDTAGQDVLVSLANWDHGAALEQLVRLVRLTRPEVVLTFLPGTFIGEDHGDHQAAGVLATEAFDLAGDPTVFPNQVAEPLKRLEAYLEGLRPWQPKKIFYFPDAEREDIFSRQRSVVFGEGNFKVVEETILAGFAGRFSSTPNAGEELCRPARQNG